MIFFSADFGWLALFIFVFTGSYVFPTLVFCTFLPTLLFSLFPLVYGALSFPSCVFFYFAFLYAQTTKQYKKNFFSFPFMLIFFRRVSIFFVFSGELWCITTHSSSFHLHNHLSHFWVQLFQFIALLYNTETNLSVLYYILLFCFN